MTDNTRAIVPDKLTLTIRTDDFDLAETINDAGIDGVKAMYKNPAIFVGGALKFMDVVAIVSTTASLLQLGIWLVDQIKNNSKKRTLTIDGIDIIKNADRIKVIIDKKVKKHLRKK
ncbi:MAG: hypothetical protein HY014_06845 [Acidobacteria bacterium]|nr:hypothetical protein [Acidobacteriota bacterium]MBI3487868.1 hypothetical protein [Acidobacteriota bacterium]